MDNYYAKIVTKKLKLIVSLGLIYLKKQNSHKRIKTKYGSERMGNVNANVITATILL